jgi:hypothetical protein
MYPNRPIYHLLAWFNYDSSCFYILRSVLEQVSNPAVLSSTGISYFHITAKH